MHLRDHGMDGVEDIVLAACLENQAYDRQCEGSRAEWMYSLFKGTPAYPRFAAAILAALARSTGGQYDDYDGEQLCHLASLMGSDGDLQAASCLRAFVRNQAMSDDGVVGASAMCALDGISAVIDVARRVGQFLQHDPQACCHSLEALTGDALPFDEAFAELGRLAAGDPAIAAYVGRQEALIARDAPDERTSEQIDIDARRYGEEFIGQNPVESIIAASTGESPQRGLFLRFGRWAGTDDLNRILDHLREQDDTDVCKQLLRVFRHATLPRLDERVWALASHSSADVRNAAVLALSSLKDPRVRALGLERLRATGFSSEFADDIALFEHNFEPGDETLILSALERQSVDGDEAHALGSNALDICASVRTAAMAGVAQWVYRTNPCTICRCRAVERLQEWGCLPAHIADEARYDASEELRELACKQT